MHYTMHSCSTIRVRHRILPVRGDVQYIVLAGGVRRGRLEGETVLVRVYGEVEIFQRTVGRSGKALGRIQVWILI